MKLMWGRTAAFAAPLHRDDAGFLQQHRVASCPGERSHRLGLGAKEVPHGLEWGATAKAIASLRVVVADHHVDELFELIQADEQGRIPTRIAQDTVHILRMAAGRARQSMRQVIRQQQEEPLDEGALVGLARRPQVRQQPTTSVSCVRV